MHALNRPASITSLRAIHRSQAQYRSTEPEVTVLEVAGEAGHSDEG